MTQYRKKPVVIEAKQWNGDNSHEIQAFLFDGNQHAAHGWVKGQYVEIGTLEGLMVASIGDWIIRGVAGEFYPCKPDIFAATYDEVPPYPRPETPIVLKPLNLPVIDPGPDSLEREIQAKADKAPRVTPADIEAEISSEHYFTAGEGIAGHCYRNVRALHSPHALELLTFCVLVLKNGYTVHGHSACASPENFNANIGRSVARENAKEKIWPLLGFRLHDALARPVLTEADAAADLAGTPRPSCITV